MSVPGHRASRALAELARARGWVEDGVLDGALDVSSRTGEDVGTLLLRSGALTGAQLESLREAVSGSAQVEPTLMPRGAAPDVPPAASSLESGATLAAPRSEGAAPGSAAAAPATVGPYRLLRELGRGGMGVVYRALDAKLGRDVALKLLLAGGDAGADLVQRFRREASVLARIGRHPHLIGVHDIGEDAGRLYFTMDYVEGRSLRARILEEGPLPAMEAARIAAEVASALAAAHAVGVVHRDVKPHNVLLDREGRAFLGDFGLARDAAAASGLTATGAIFGTPAYMPPEQAAGRAKQAGALADVYSLGATLYEMITGHPPFAGNVPADVLRRVLEIEPAAPRTLRLDLHPDLETVCQKAMRKDPARRYPSAADFERDLRHFLAGEPIEARPVGPLERLAAWARRRRGAVAAAALGALASLGVVGEALRREWRRRDDAERWAAAERERSERAGAFEREAQDLVDRAEAAQRNGDWAGARRLAEEAAVRLRAGLAAVETAGGRYLLGRALRLGGRPHEALGELDRAVALDDRHARAWFEHGSILQERLFSELMRTGRGMGLRSASIRSGTATGLGAMSRDASAAVTAAMRPDRERAAEDYRRALELPGGADLAAYGNAQLLFLVGKDSEAVAEIDRAIALNPYSAAAHHAKADMLEILTRDPLKAIDSRRRAWELEPHHPFRLTAYGQGLAACGRLKEASAIAEEALRKLPESPELLDQVSLIFMGCGKLDTALGLSLRMEEIAATPAERWNAARRVLWVYFLMRRWDDELAHLERRQALFHPDEIAFFRGEVAEQTRRYGEAARLMRRVPPESFFFEDATAARGRVERWCGNLDASERCTAMLPEWCLDAGERLDAAILLMERGRYDDALRSFDALIAQSPEYNFTYVNRAGTLFLLDRYPDAMAALEKTVLATDLSEEQRASAREIFKGLKKRAAEVRTPKEAGAVVESLAGMLTFVRTQVPRGSAAEEQVRDAILGIHYLLQMFYFDHSLYEEAIVAGGRAQAIERSGTVLYRDARARAAAGKRKSALKSLAEAIAEGFDDGSRLDSDEAFEKLRGTEEYEALRGRCRSAISR